MYPEHMLLSTALLSSFLFKFIYFGLCWVFVAASRSYSLVVVYTFLFAMASLVTEHDL